MLSDDDKSWIRDWFGRRIAPQLKELADGTRTRTDITRGLQVEAHERFLGDADKLGEALEYALLLRPDTDSPARSVDAYLQILGILTGIVRSLTAETEPSHQDMRRIWSLLQDARIFHIKPPTYVSLYHRADVYTTETIAGLDWTPEGTGDSSPEETSHLVTSTEMAAKSIRLPENMAFPVMFFGYGHGIMLRDTQLYARCMFQVTGHDSILLGSMVSPDLCVDFILTTPLHGNQALHTYVAWTSHSQSGCGWLNGFDLNAWVMPAMVELVNSHKTYLVSNNPSGNQRDDIKRLREKLKVTKAFPRPYYTLDLRDDVVANDITTRFPKRSVGFVYKHRFDVRGHECVRVIRGQLPISATDEAKLLKRGYRIYKVAVAPDDLARLVTRNLALNTEGNWIAVMNYWQKQHQKGPAGAPYFPAVRIPTKEAT